MSLKTSNSIQRQIHSLCSFIKSARTVFIDAESWSSIKRTSEALRASEFYDWRYKSEWKDPARNVGFGSVKNKRSAERQTKGTAVFFSLTDLSIVLGPSGTLFHVTREFWADSDRLENWSKAKSHFRLLSRKLFNCAREKKIRRDDNYNCSDS